MVVGQVRDRLSCPAVPGIYNRGRGTESVKWDRNTAAGKEESHQPLRPDGGCQNRTPTIKIPDRLKVARSGAATAFDGDAPSDHNTFTTVAVLRLLA